VPSDRSLSGTFETSAIAARFDTILRCIPPSPTFELIVGGYLLDAETHVSITSEARVRGIPPGRDWYAELYRNLDRWISESAPMITTTAGDPPASWETPALWTCAFTYTLGAVGGILQVRIVQSDPGEAVVIAELSEAPVASMKR